MTGTGNGSARPPGAPIPVERPEPEVPGGPVSVAELVLFLLAHRKRCDELLERMEAFGIVGPADE